MLRPLHVCVPTKPCCLVCLQLIHFFYPTPGDFLVTSAKEKTLRSWMMRTYATALEDERVEIRRAACRALSVLEAIECVQELIYVIEYDPSSVVKSEAKEALLSLGTLIYAHHCRVFFSVSF